MKRIILAALAALLLLAGCAPRGTADTRIQVSVRETPGITVANNGQLIQPGEDVTFLLESREGLAVVGADYEGDTFVSVEDGKYRLTLKNVRYPTRVEPKLTEHFQQIRFDPNGGTGSAVTIPVDTTNHLRPNTSTGVELFSRDGYSLVSWNTEPDGSAQRIGLGSRVGAGDDGLTLYAQWAQWSEAGDFTWEPAEQGIRITGYHGSDAVVVIPETIDGRPVTAIAAGAFQKCTMTDVILPKSMETVEKGAFQNCSLQTLTLSDNIETISDASFSNCKKLKTLYINAVEKPYGTDFRRESCYADKVEMLIQAQGQKKVIFYSGCSAWYNLDAATMMPLMEQGYRLVNMGLNGLVNSAMQMQIMEHFLEPGDILVHTPELSSNTQLLNQPAMTAKDDNKLWCGLEYNYDLFTLADMRTLPGALDSFCAYLASKQSKADYSEIFMSDGNVYCDEYGCIPFFRAETSSELPDRVYLDPTYFTSEGMGRLKGYYDRYQAKGVRIYVSYACTNMDDVPEEQKDNVGMMDDLFRKNITEMQGPVLISELDDYLFQNSDYYDTNYHLRSEPARNNTRNWLRDLQAQMVKDGLWEES